ncbi:MAG: hypothetical protein IJ861_10200, partial [Clostridia bacterium]|nr:hypothetical protein [Clostridia bacterium]
MSEKMPNNNESSPIRSLFRRNEEAYEKHQKEKDQQSADTKEDQYDDYEPEMADDTAAKPKSGLRAAFGKFVEIITQTDDMDLISEDDDEEIEDIFAEDTPGNKPSPEKKPSAVNTSHSSAPEKPQEKKPPEQKKPESKKTPQKSPEYASEAVLYSAAKSQKEEPKAAEPAPAAEKTPKAEPEKSAQTSAEDAAESVIYHSPKVSQPPNPTSAAPKKTADGKTEITLDDILRVKSTALEHTTFQYTSDDFFAEPKPPVQPLVQKTSELSHDIPVKPPVQPPVQKTSELSHDILVKP